MITPYWGTSLPEDQESFNFWQSQLRITIERAFGILIQRFGIFWKDLQFDASFIPEIVHACCRLHNFCFRQNLKEDSIS
jgi:hypothetical protein